ncbi:sodium:solute symporter family protein [Paludisphaera sp.]|uniref:sodium:solute symporter family protein n=1 Tax=Paludisphaera sp. TaxID=2017432 RepID=UPI00301DF1A9
MHTSLAWIDYLIMVIYFAFVLGIGFALKRFMKTSTDFFLSGRSIPAWVAGLAFISANLGAQEVIGMAASGAKYGISTAHFYWLGAIPAMAFVGLFMMPFYYGSRARSVPEYLRLRFDEKTRGLNAISFAAMTVFSSGASMYVMAKLIVTLGIFDPVVEAMGMPPSYVFHLSILVSALITLGYVYLGGLTSAIYNEVLQFFLIVAGFFPLVWLGMRNVGGWEGLIAKCPPGFGHAWKGMTNPETNPLGVEVIGLAMGLGFVLSFGYWCTDFLVVQRAMAADSMTSARRTPLIAAVPKMIFPFLVILPGLIAVALPTPTAADAPEAGSQVVSEAETMGRGLIPAKVKADGSVELDSAGKPVLDYDLAIPRLLIHYFPTGLLGLGLTALLASFMSGMAGNITAFNTVWTFDIYQAYLQKPIQKVIPFQATDKHYLWMGHFATLAGTVVSVAAAYVAAQFNNIMELLQLVFAFVNAPLLATFLLGMFWKRATANGAFYGLLSGILAATAHHALTLPMGSASGVKGAWIANLHEYRSEMAQNFWTAIWAFGVCFVVSIVVSFLTRPRPDDELRGLVYSLTKHDVEHGLPWYRKPETLGVVVVLMSIALNIIFR